MTKIVFFGTENFAAAMLAALLDNQNFEVVAAVTAPDRPVGRHQILQKSPVKILAEKYSLKIFQPESLKNFTDFTTLDFGLNVVCDYGLIIPKEILDVPKFGSINIHPSLLPKYRGPSPIQTALINGDKKTGVTIMLMDEKMDHGPILAQKTVSVGPDDTYPQLSQKLAKEAQILLLNTLTEWIKGQITPKPQAEAEVTFCHIFKRDDGLIDFKKTAVEIYNQFRGLTPWPGIWFNWQGKRVKLLQIKLANLKAPQGLPRLSSTGASAGEFVGVSGKLFLGCRGGSLEVLELQAEGKKAMNAKEFMNGYKIKL